MQFFVINASQFLIKQYYCKTSHYLIIIYLLILFFIIKTFKSKWDKETFFSTIISKDSKLINRFPKIFDKITVPYKVL